MMTVCSTKCRWDRCTAFAATWGGAIFGCAGGVITWLVYADIKYGVVNIESTEQNMPVLAAEVVSFGLGIVVPPIIVRPTPLEVGSMMNTHWQM